MDTHYIPPELTPGTTRFPKTRWYCDVCRHLNSYRKIKCARPKCPGRKDGA